MKFDRAPAGLALYMDGVKRAEIKEGSDSEFVDMMDWHLNAPKHGKSLPTSSFKLIWDLDKTISRVNRPVGLRRVTIGYAHEGLITQFLAF